MMQFHSESSKIVTFRLHYLCSFLVRVFGFQFAGEAATSQEMYRDVENQQG